MKEKKFYLIILHILQIIVFTIFYCIPIIASFVMSFTNWNIKRISEPKFVAFKNFGRLFRDDYFLLALKNTILFAVVTTLGIVILGLLLALLLNSAIKGKTFLRTCFYAFPAVLSLIVVGIMFKAVFKLDGGILNQILTAVGLENLVRDWLGDGKTAMWAIIFVQILEMERFCYDNLSGRSSGDFRRLL